LALPAPQRQADYARAFCCKLESPRSCHREAGYFRDDRAQLGMAQRFFEAGEDG
jgi:hypothetical protein